MGKQATGAVIPVLAAGDAGGTLHQQVYARIRAAILEGHLPPRSRVPSSRTLARDLGVSRNTVEEAFGRLDAEGFLERRVGSGSYVALPEHARPPALPPLRAVPAGVTAGLSQRGQRMLAQALAPEPRAARPLTPCMPALDAFPTELWSRTLTRQARRMKGDALAYGEAAGLAALREAVAHYLATARGVRCEARRVLVLPSTQAALDLTARLLLDESDEVWLEEPGYMGARGALQGAGARVRGVPVDAQGLDVAAGRKRAPAARLAYVTPSHQYPLGVTMSLQRRLALLAWAAEARAWVVEDDYDSEFRYAERPLAAIQGLDTAGRVLYVGSFTKVMFPGLRLAYLVLPESLVDAFTAARALADGHTPVLAQAAMAEFMEAGHFAAHLRTMRGLYAERREALLDGLERECGGALEVLGDAAGMHVCARLTGRRDDEALTERAIAKGLDPRALSAHFLGKERTPGMLLGFSGSPPAELRRAARVLGSLL
ncbi:MULTISPECIES: PLP-dependent aminotransferase family protein [Myxococcaceae]|uniref:MocR-like pyridoxine biosynthesis transcription factor PdxR n=1 Tax=Myxococcaceae TaxID=31 RepID=UPI00188F3AC4|nr:MULTISPECIES: PLP-dependent aminotransferase family protein [Myxococcaceae]MBF5041897.1 PLP-dependent aminotransferase family protein [Simulacricoccus sp. 17bor-14]